MDLRTRAMVKGYLQKRAAEKPELRQELLRDPRAAVKRELDFDLPADLETDQDEGAHQQALVDEAAQRKVDAQRPDHGMPVRHTR